ncbi:MAG: hypothetical protein WCR45_07860 [Bacteroidaceae bacterium]
MYEIKRDEESINALLNECLARGDRRDGATEFSGMTYEQGIIAAIDWLTGTINENPLDE